MVTGSLFHKERPIYDKVFLSPVRLVKRVLKLCKTISCVYSTVWSKFKNFIHINRTVVIDKLESYCTYALLNSFFSREPIYQSKLCKGYILHYLI